MSLVGHNMQHARKPNSILLPLPLATNLATMVLRKMVVYRRWMRQLPRLPART